MMRTVALAGAVLALAACTAGESYRDEDRDLVAAPQVDLSRYAGRWFEIARFPNRFEKNCAGVSHDYTPKPDGRLDVVITCRLATLAGPIEQFEGEARVTGDRGSELKISFSDWVPWFFDGDYVILDVGPDYRTAVVGAPDGTVGWILGREPVMAEEDLRHGYDVLWRNGYDLIQILLVDQPAVGN